MSRNKLFTQVQLDILCQLVAVIYEIVITFILNKLVCFLTDSVNIEVIADRSVKYDHFAICIKIIISGLHGFSVRIEMSRNKPFAQIQSDILCQLMTVIDKIVIAVFILNQLI